MLKGKLFSVVVVVGGKGKITNKQIPAKKSKEKSERIILKRKPDCGNKSG